MGLDLENNAFSQKMIIRKNLAFFLNFLNMAKMGAEMGAETSKMSHICDGYCAKRENYHKIASGCR